MYDACAVLFCLFSSCVLCWKLFLRHNGHCSLLDKLVGDSWDFFYYFNMIWISKGVEWVFFWIEKHLIKQKWPKYTASCIIVFKIFHNSNFISCSSFIPLDVRHIYFIYSYNTDISYPVPTYYEILSHIKMMFDNKSKYLPFFTSFLSTGELDKKTGKCCCCCCFFILNFFSHFEKNIDGKIIFSSFILIVSLFYCRHRTFTYSAPAYPHTHQMKDFR